MIAAEAVKSVLGANEDRSRPILPESRAISEVARTLTTLTPSQSRSQAAPSGIAARWTQPPGETTATVQAGLGDPELKPAPRIAVGSRMARTVGGQDVVLPGPTEAANQVRPMNPLPPITRTRNGCSSI